MDFGRLESIEHVNFDLPANFAHNNVLTQNFTKGQRASLYVGAPVWADKDFVGTLYPKGTKPADFLYHYTRQFNTIELNVTHYQMPEPERVRGWAQKAAPGFLFCPKITQTISHRNDLGLRGGELDRFLNGVIHFGEHLGPCFLQLPPHFGPEKLPLLQDFLQAFPEDVPLAVEVRHPDWFRQPAILKDYIDLLASFGRTAIIADVAGRRDVLHMGLSSPMFMLRFNGHNLHATDFTRMDAWVNRLERWISLGVQQIFFFLHQPGAPLATKAAQYLIPKLNKLNVQPITAPQPPAGSQQSLF